MIITKEAWVRHFGRCTRVGLGGTRCATWMQLHTRPLTNFFFFFFFRCGPIWSEIGADMG